MTSVPTAVAGRSATARSTSLVAELTRAWRRLGRGSHRLAIIALIGSILRSLSVVPIAFVLRRLTDRTLPSHNSAAVVREALLLLLLVALSALVSYGTRRSVLRVTQRGLERLRLDVLEKLYALPRSFYDAVDDSDVQSLVVQDTGRLELVLTTTVSGVLPAAAVAVAVAVVAAVLQPVLFLVALVLQPATLIVGRLLVRKVRLRTSQWQRAVDRYSGDVARALRAMTLTQVTGTKALELSRQADTIGAVHDSALALANTQASARARLMVTSAAGGAVLLGMGAVEVADGRLTAGTLVSFFAVVAVLARQANLVLGSVPQLAAAAESFARIEALLDTPPNPPYVGRRPHLLCGAITLDGVTFGYGNSVPVLRGVSLEIRDGEHVALIGPNGSGKSTLAMLVLGLYRPSVGSLLLDGVPYDEVDLAVLHAGCGVVLQDPVLLPGSIRDAVRHGRPDVTDQQIADAAALVGLDHIVLELPDGWDTRLGDEGSRFSGGQRQRVALARALVTRPRILVLDEPTNHLDDAATQLLLHSLRSLMPAPTVFTITHDPLVAEAADRVVHLRDGRLTAAGAAAGGGVAGAR